MGSTPAAISPVLASVFLPSAFFLLASCGQRGGIHALAFSPVVAPTRSPMSRKFPGRPRTAACRSRGPEEREAFAALYDRLSGPLYTLCLRMVGDAEEAEDALQEAFLSLWRRAADYDGARSSVFSWAVLITRGKAIDHLRSRGRRLRVVVPDDPAPGNDGRRFRQRPRVARAGNGSSQRPRRGGIRRPARTRGRVRRIIGALPPEQCQAIEMAFFGDLTHHENFRAAGSAAGHG